MFGLRSVALMLGFAVVLSASFADAAPSAQDKASAKTLWVKGKRLAAQKQSEQAIEALKGAVALDPKVQYELDLARELENVGRLIEAREHAEAAVRSTEQNAGKGKKAAKDLSATIGPRIPSLRVEVKGVAATEAKITLDDEPFEIDVDVPIDPGEHLVEGRVASQPSVLKTVVVKEAAHDTVTLEFAAPKVAEAPADSSGGGNMAPAAVAYAVGGAGLIAGGILGGLAFMQTSTVTDECGGTKCPSKFADDVALAQTYGTASTVLFAVGGLGVAAGIVLTVTVGINGDESEGDAKKDAGIRVQPFFSPTGAGLTGTF